MPFTITKGQVYALKRLLGEITENEIAALFIAGRLVAKELKSMFELSIDDWRKIRDEAYPYWEEDDWNCSTEFKGKISTIHTEWEKSQGQLFLFDIQEN